MMDLLIQVSSASPASTERTCAHVLLPSDCTLRVQPGQLQEVDLSDHSKVSYVDLPFLEL